MRVQNPSYGPVVDGYDVVAYFSLPSDAQGVKGSSEFSRTLNGYSFHFANEANAAAFEADPHRFAPQFGGF